MKLSPEQAAILERSIEGGHAVFAGPGSGKTALLIERVNKVGRERECLCLTFTRNAASEMRHRARTEAEFKTIDALAYRFWKEHDWRFGYTTKGWQILTNRGRLKLAQEIVAELVPKRYCPSTFLQEVAKRKRLADYPFILQVPIEDMYEFYLGKIDQELLDLMREFELRKRRNKLIEFEDLELLMLEALLDEEVVYQVEDLSVDEAHDLSKLQWRLIGAIRAENLFIVGSPEQSIYSFRQANPQFMMEFIESKNLEVHRLKANFRSAKLIVDLANRIFPVSVSFKSSKGRFVDLGHFESIKDEAKAVLDEAERWLAEGDVGILSRTNMQIVPIVVELMKRQMKYRTAKSIFDRMSVKLLRCWLHGDETSARFVADLTDLDLKAVVKTSMQARESGDAKIAISMIRKAFGLDSYLSMNFFDEESFDDEMWLLDMIENLAAGTSVEEFLDKLKAMQMLEDDEAPITISTIHGAKGLEWHSVFIVGLTEGILPHARGLLDEEKRLFYVAITRAKENLVISSANIRRCVKRSSFIDLLSGRS